MRGFGDIIDMGQPGAPTTVKVCPDRHYFDQGFCHSVDQAGSQVVPDAYNCQAKAQSNELESAKRTQNMKLVAASASALIIGFLIGKMTP